METKGRAIDREETVAHIEDFKSKFTSCRMSDREQGFVDGLDCCIIYIKKFAPDADIAKQIGFDFSQDCQWK